ncbi:heterokaryon incompatibility protein [Colletotrichum kahawae]|uniref:Heterokaryon incompatibility protein n=1 Tax=Colletotrichum kahawae TaxID=34407 RepID=A0AAD9XXU0_COLKA|nr:heterokaryon incompatibility protein [Colletotrichum kahawae]
MHSVYGNLPRGHIRLLTVHPGNETTALSGTLLSTPLEAAPEFEAVSYAWGTGSFTETLNIISNPGTASTSGEHGVSGAGQISITHNVTSLSRCLRRESEARVLWIDAICINQANITERNDQVQRMRKIYSRARVVVIWLGPATEGDGSDRAIAFLNQMGQSQNHRSNTESQRTMKTSVVSDASMQEDDSTFSQESEDYFESTNVISSTPPLTERASLPRNLLSPARMLLSLTATFRDWVQIWSQYIRTKSSKNYNYYVNVKVWNPWELHRQSLARSKTARLEMAYFVDIKVDEEISHVTLGAPGFYENEMFQFHGEEFQDDWAAIDELMHRPWWSRTWVVQEVWSARGRVVLQCGHHTLTWETFQNAMNYHDYWDDMGELIKGDRAGRWGQFQRRYGLALHLCKMRLLDGKLSDLLWNTWDREAKDPRDKVFCETARDIIRTEDSLDILLAAGGPRNDVGGGQLPSWVPDWRGKANEARPVLFVNRARLISPFFGGSMEVRLLFGHGYAACADKKPVAWFSEDFETLHTHAIFVDEVSSSCGTAQGPGPIEPFSIRDEAYFQARYALAGTTQPWWMAEKKAKNEDRYWWLEKRSGRSDLRHIVEMTLCAGSAADSTTSDVIRNVMPLRRFFVTKHERYMGIGPSALRPGDKVFIIAGCNFPVILRETVSSYRKATGTFELVGEAYVHFIMAGEAISKIQETTWWEDLLWFRPLKRVRWREVAIQ